MREEPPALPPQVLEHVASPALVVDLGRVRGNVRLILERIGTPERWRAHVKTAKIPELFAELARAGLRRFKCATVREARHLLDVLAREGIREPDVLVAHTLLGPGLRALARVAAEHPGARLSVLAEDGRRLGQLPAEIGIFVDVNPGMDRTGLAPDDLPSIAQLARAAGTRFRGLHWYEGHLHQPDPLERRRAACAGYGRALELAMELKERDAPVQELVTSGTPAFLHALAFPAFSGPEAPLHTVSPGTVVLHDARTERENPTLDLEPAAVVLARVVSRPRRAIVTCDAGSKSVAAEGAACARVLGRPELVPLAPSEEHLPLRVAAGAAPELGEPLYLFPEHVCPTVNLADEALLVDGGEARPVPVAARGHDLWIDD